MEARDNTKELKPNQCREAFEAWARNECMEMTRKNKGYLNHYVYWAWQGFQAAYAARPVPTEEELQKAEDKIATILANVYRDYDSQLDDINEVSEWKQEEHRALAKQILAALNAYINGR